MSEMPRYYLEDLPDQQCSTYKCPTRATVRLLAVGKVNYGPWCRRCGAREVKQRNALSILNPRGKA